MPTESARISVWYWSNCGPSAVFAVFTQWRSHHRSHASGTVLNSRGYAVSVNHPYKGVELVRKHGRPAEGRHSIQIEVNKRLYMDENTQKLHAGFLSVRRVLLELSQQLLRGVPLHDA